LKTLVKEERFRKSSKKGQKWRNAHKQIWSILSFD
jgi:hypothetical protein